MTTTAPADHWALAARPSVIGPRGGVSTDTSPAPARGERLRRVRSERQKRNMGKLSYFMVGSNRLADANGCYDTPLDTARMAPLFEHPSGGRVYGSWEGLSFAGVGPFEASRPWLATARSSRSALIAVAEPKWTPHAQALALGGRERARRGIGLRRCTSRISVTSTLTSSARYVWADSSGARPLALSIREK